MGEALELTALIAKDEPGRLDKVAGRWLALLLEERGALPLSEAAFVVGCLAALGGDRREEALLALRAQARLSSYGRDGRGARDHVGS